MEVRGLGAHIMAHACPRKAPPPTEQAHVSTFASARHPLPAPGAQVGALLGTLMLIDAGFSGDWSRIGAITKGVLRGLCFFPSRGWCEGRLTRDGATEVGVAARGGSSPRLPVCALRTHARAHTQTHRCAHAHITCRHGASAADIWVHCCHRARGHRRRSRLHCKQQGKEPICACAQGGARRLCVAGGSAGRALRLLAAAAVAGSGCLALVAAACLRAMLPHTGSAPLPPHYHRGSFLARWDCTRSSTPRLKPDQGSQPGIAARVIGVKGCRLHVCCL